MRDYTDRQVNPPKQVTSSTWAPHVHVNMLYQFDF